MGLQDDIVYLVLLLTSIALGAVFQRIERAHHRRSFSTLCGLLMVGLVSGWHAFFCVLAYGVQVLCIQILPWTCLHIVSFWVQMMLLVCFRLCHWVGLPNVPAHANPIIMMLTLKLIGLAFEIHDTEKLELEIKSTENADEVETKKLQLKWKGINPSLTDTFHYAFGYTGILTGPYFKFRTFNDLYSTSFGQLEDCTRQTLTRISRVPIYIALFLLSGYLFPLKVVEEEDFYEKTSLLYRVFYMTPVFFNFRMRLYTGFVLSECSCIMAGLGMYPKSSEPRPGNGPTQLEALENASSTSNGTEDMNFESVHNIDEYGADFVPTMREALRTWNMTVQYWLANIVYRRFPMKTLRTAAVMIVSSMWHGVHPGYYLSLGSVPLVLIVEDLYDRIVRRKLSQKGQATYDWLSWFYRMQQFSYLGMAFQLLKIGETLTFWHSIAYLGHLILPIIYLLGLFIVKPLFSSRQAIENKKID
ncbi:hypothetical protein TCAL_03048 [Tigriopus californicus]|uniref:Lysophospholipid acyltransferase 7 n=1 Tax=Tigriopus californicus TaxID=6832 RepID=A0A553NTU3_TIGCA|nr:lysophospholipid acyltransferase 7-like [Tigriopus californicus]TRY68844.1 hypothetical protein TCAL_03048 [Tigriopus californicus]